MAFHNTRSHYRIRRGSMIIEVVVASILFATALIALGRLARTSTSLNVLSDQRLSAKLTAENAITRLQALDFDAIDTKRDSIATQLSESADLDVQIQTQSFSIDNQDAMKLTVHVTDQTGVIGVKLHDWRIKTPVEKTEPPAEKPEPPAAETEPPAKTETVAEKTAQDDSKDADDADNASDGVDAKEKGSDTSDDKDVDSQEDGDE